MGKISKDKRDIYYRLAKQKGYRSRSAFKLLQIDQFFNIFQNSNYVVDLCAAPGGWSQVAFQKLSEKFKKDIEDQSNKNFKIISVDLQEMSPIEGVDILIGDITNQSTLLEIINLSDNKMIDLVLCDGAPDVTGFNEFDVHIQIQLILYALNISIRMLREGGTFISKVFKGKHTLKIMFILSLFFDKITIAKPKACRNASFESFVVCQEFKIDDEFKFLRENDLDAEDIIFLNALFPSNLEEMNIEGIEEISLDKLGIQLIQVGEDLFDSDKTYDLESTNYTIKLNPLQTPINPPYKSYIDNFKGIKK